MNTNERITRERIRSNVHSGTAGQWDAAVLLQALERAEADLAAALQRAETAENLAKETELRRRESEANAWENWGDLKRTMAKLETAERALAEARKNTSVALD